MTARAGFCAALRSARLGSIRAVAVLLLCLLWTMPAQAARRAALIIGNATYANAATLANTISDARRVAEAAQKAGFTVTLATDLSKDGFNQALRQFRDQADGSEVAMVYYAGHGIEGGGKNWLLPVDVKLTDPRDLSLEALELNTILSTLEGARLRIVALDACRENPFGNSWRSGTRAVAQGLAETEIDGALVLYAAAGGQLALDTAGNGTGSPFAEALARHLPEPGLSIHRLGPTIRDDVKEVTGGRQTPWMSVSIGSEDLALVPKPQAPVALAPAPAPAVSPGLAMNEAMLWPGVDLAGTVESYEGYLAAFPQGQFANLARIKLDRLRAPAPAPAPAPVSAPVPAPAPQLVQAVAPAPQVAPAPAPAIPVQPQPQPQFVQTVAPAAPVAPAPAPAPIEPAPVQPALVQTVAPPAPIAPIAPTAAPAPVAPAPARPALVQAAAPTPKVAPAPAPTPTPVAPAPARPALVQAAAPTPKMAPAPAPAPAPATPAAPAEQLTWDQGPASAAPASQAPKGGFLGALRSVAEAARSGIERLRGKSDAPDGTPAAAPANTTAPATATAPAAAPAAPQSQIVTMAPAPQAGTVSYLSALRNPRDTRPLPAIPAAPRLSTATYPTCREAYQTIPGPLDKIAAINRCIVSLGQFSETVMNGYAKAMIVHQNDISHLYSDLVAAKPEYTPESQNWFYSEVMREHVASNPGGANYSDYAEAKRRFDADIAYLRDRYCFWSGTCGGYSPPPGVGVVAPLTQPGAR